MILLNCLNYHDTTELA